MKVNMKNIFIALVFIILYLPIATLIAFSFNNANYSMQWTSFSTKWYHTLLQDRELISSSINSFVLAFISSTLASLIALANRLCSYFKKNNWLESFSESSTLLLVVIPDIVFACALLIIFKLLNLKLGFLSLLIAHTSFCLPFSLIIIQSQLSLIPKTLFYASYDLGGEQAFTIKKILLPLLLPSLIASWLMCFTLSFDDVLISYFLSGPDFKILPVELYGRIRVGITPEINALCSLLFVFSMSLILVSQFLLRKRK